MNPKKGALLILFILTVLVAFMQDDTPVRSLSKEEFAKAITNRQVQLVDVRTAAEFKTGHIPQARNIDIKDKNFDEQAGKQLDLQHPVAVYCRSGVRSQTAARKLAAKGYQVFELQGGISGWKGEITKDKRP